MKDFLLFKIEEKSDQKYHTSLMATLAGLENQYCHFVLNGIHNLRPHILFLPYKPFRIKCYS